MEANKIKGTSQTLMLDNGVELTYCERGQQNEEIIIMPGFFFYTFMPLLEGLAARYHVYDIIMRFDGPGEELNPDGTINWTRQWGKDVYDFCVKQKIVQYIHFGKVSSIIATYASAPEMIWANPPECAENLQNITVPVCYLFGTKDEFFDDHYDSNMWAIRNTRGSRTIFLQGEHHLMELDCPERVVNAAFEFFAECDKGYYKELLD